MDDSDSNGGTPGGYDSETGRYRVQYDRQTAEPVTTVVVKAVAALTDTLPTELEPLYDTVDPDALNQLYRFASRHPRDTGDGHVTFTYNGCRVTVFSTGVIDVEPDADSSR